MGILNVGKNPRGKNVIGKNVRGRIARGKNVRTRVVKNTIGKTAIGKNVRVIDWVCLKREFPRVQMTNTRRSSKH